MGSSHSSTTINETVDEVTKNTTNIMNKMTNNSSQVCNTNQQLEVTTGVGSVINCSNVTLGNVLASKCDMSAVFTQTGSTSILNTLNNAVDQASKSSNKAVQGFLSTTVSDQNQNINMATHIKNVLSKNLTTNMQNTCIQNSNGDQNNKLVLNGTINCPNGGSLSAGNNAQVSALASCVTNQAIDILSKDDIINSAVQKLEASNSSKQTGPIQELGKAISDAIGQMGKIGAIIAIVAIVVVIGAVIFLLSPSGQAISEKVADKKL